ncbi:COG1361 S-layer family protein [Natronococcus wangiae]|uniref:COG1361 S-layer family protein n=1 Tax=Natronococcus wangiae TaxID=3068275 RepID=UPI00273F4712|nr:hypothetical protein [Natronococcus sp. AD5]
MAARTDSSARFQRRVGIAALSLLLIVALLVGASGLTGIAAQENDSDGRAGEMGNETPTEPPREDEDAPPDGETPPDDAPPLEDDEPEPGAGDAIEPPTQAPEDDGDVTVALENGSVPATGVETLAFEVDNEADDEIRDVVVTLRSGDPALFFGSPSAPQQQRSVHLEALSSDDSETVDVDVGAARVTPGSYPLFATIQYVEDDDDGGNGDDGDDNGDDDDGDDDEVVRTVGPTLVPVEVNEALQFEATNVSERVPVDGESSYAVRITNEGNETATDVVATAETGPPLSSPSPSAYVGTLEPGESETVRFGLEPSEGAIETTDSIAVTLTYDAASGERTSADPIQVPVSIVEDDDEAAVESIAPLAAAVAVLVLVAAWWWRRR